MGGSDWGADWGGLKTALGDWKPVLWARMEQMQNCSRNGQYRKATADGSFNCPMGIKPLDSNDWSFFTREKMFLSDST